MSERISAAGSDGGARGRVKHTVLSLIGIQMEFTSGSEVGLAQPGREGGERESERESERAGT